MDADLLRKTWAEVDRLGEEPIEFFYGHLFASRPALRPMFGTHMREQRAKLRATLRLVVGAASNLDALRPTLRQLGAFHRDLGVTDADYGDVATSLLATLALYLDDQWTPEVEAAWTNAYIEVVKEMTGSPQRAPVDPVEGAGHV